MDHVWILSIEIELVTEVILIYPNVAKESLYSNQIRNFYACMSARTNFLKIAIEEIYIFNLLEINDFCLKAPRPSRVWGYKKADARVQIERAVFNVADE